MSVSDAPEIGSNLWNSRVYAGLSVASQVAAGLEQAASGGITLFLPWKIYRGLGELNKDLLQIIAEYDRAVCVSSDIPTEMVRVGRDSLLKLYSDCTGLYSHSERLPLQSLFKRRLAILRENAERILDMADWFDAMSNPEETNARFDAALSDLAKGDVVPWSAVR